MVCTCAGVSVCVWRTSKFVPGWVAIGINHPSTGERTSHFAEYTTPAEEMSPVAVCVSPTFDINQGLDHSVL